MNVLLMKAKSKHMQWVFYPGLLIWQPICGSLMILYKPLSCFAQAEYKIMVDNSSIFSPCSAGWSDRRGRAQQDAENAQTSSAFHPSGLHSLNQSNTNTRRDK